MSEKYVSEKQRRQFEENQVAREKLERHAYELYTFEGLRRDFIAKEMGVSVDAVRLYINAEKVRIDANERVKYLRRSAPHAPSKVTASVKAGLVAIHTDAPETPMKQVGRFLDSDEGRQALERMARPYDPAKPEALSYRSHSKNPLLEYGGGA